MNRYSLNQNFPPVVKNLIIINVLVWVAQLALDPAYNFTSDIGLWPIGTAEFQPWQVITHMFAHAAYNSAGGIVLYHILFNMFGLWMFGRVLENLWGSKKFLIFYLICGLGAAALHLAVQYYTGSYSVAVGASGAVYGILVGFAFLFPNTPLFLMFIPIPIKAKWAIIGILVLDLIGGFSSASGGSTGIAHAAHIGGAITGFLLVWYWHKKGKNFYR